MAKKGVVLEKLEKKYVLLVKHKGKYKIFDQNDSFLDLLNCLHVYIENVENILKTK